MRVDPVNCTVPAQAKSGWAGLTRRPRPSRLAVPAGIVTRTGLAGLTLGGGIGWLMRKYGLTIDQLLSVDLVTADEELLKASATENGDLFWGVREAEGFGIVTEFEFRLNPVGPPGPRRAGHLADGAVGRGAALPGLDSPTYRIGLRRWSCARPPLPVLPHESCTADPSSR